MQQELAKTKHVIILLMSTNNIITSLTHTNRQTHVHTLINTDVTKKWFGCHTLINVNFNPTPYPSS